VGLDVADHQTNADLADAILAWGNEADEIAVGVGRTARGVHTVAGDDQLPIAGGQGIGQRRGLVSADTRLEAMAQETGAGIARHWAAEEETRSGPIHCRRR
jgi:hypothetical protein